MYYCIALQDCNEYGGVDACLKASIDDIFQSNLQKSNDEQNAILEKKFERHLVSATAEEASLNFGKYSELLIQLKVSRSYKMVNINC